MTAVAETVRSISSPSPSPDLSEVLPDIAGRLSLFARARPHRPLSLAAATAAVMLHAGLLYALVDEDARATPRVSVPLVVSLVSAETPVPPKPRLTPPPSKPRVQKTVVEKTPTVAEAPAALPPPSPQQPVVAEETPPPVAAASPEPQAPAPPQLVPPRFDADYLDNPVPAYPLISRRLGEEGRVMLRVYVGADGTARDVRVDESSGSPRLDRAAKEAVERWRFLPAREGDRAVDAWVVVPVRFSLSNRS